MRVAGGQTSEAVAMVQYLLGLLNDNLDAQFSASMMIGGDPNAINATGMWESMEQYETFRSAVAEDPEVATAIRIGAHFFTDDVEDTMWQVHSAPGDAERYAIITGVRMNLARVRDALAFAADAAGVVSGITGKPVGVATAITGDISRLLWVGYAPDLSTLESNSQALQASEDYSDLFANAAELVVPGSFESNIWHNLTD
jgi:hypothetical protein